MAVLEKLIEGRPVTPDLFGMILDVVQGHYELIPCPCRLREEIAPPPSLHVEVPEDYTEPPPKFSSYRTSAGTEKALEVCCGWVCGYILGKRHDPPMLLGPCGTGKTRLLWTMVAELSAGLEKANRALYEAQLLKADFQEDVERRPAYRRLTWRYVSMPRFSEEVRRRSSFGRTWDLGEYRSGLTGCDLLVLDDLGAEAQNDLVREQLYLVVDGRVTARRPTVVASNLSLEELRSWCGERLASRLLGACEVVELMGSDMRLAAKTRRSANVQS